MDLKKIIVNSLEYNLWVNEQYCHWLSEKSDVLLNMHVESSFPSILLTIQHILHTQKYWSSVLQGQLNLPIEQNQIDPEQPKLDRKTIFTSLIESSRNVLQYIKGLNDSELLKSVEIKNEWFTCDFTKLEYVQQLTFHGAYHRGQIITIGRNIGIVDAPLTDYNFWNLYKDRTELVAYGIQ